MTDLQLALPTLVPDLIERFASRKGYELPVDVLPGLEALCEIHPRITFGIISNSDPRSIRALESLGIVPRFVSKDKWVVIRLR